MRGPAVFVGYSIQNEDEGYASYAEGDDLGGKIAVLFRFEPMDDEGGSRWAENGWSGRASFVRRSAPPSSAAPPAS